jgi:hypothetical protein
MWYTCADVCFGGLNAWRSIDAVVLVGLIKMRCLFLFLKCLEFTCHVFAMCLSRIKFSQLLKTAWVWNLL